MPAGGGAFALTAVVWRRTVEDRVGALPVEGEGEGGWVEVEA